MKKMKQEMSEKNKVYLLIGLGILPIIVAFLLKAIVIIETGNVGVKYRLGQIDRNEVTPGLHFVMPIIEKVEDVFTKTIMVNYTDIQKRDTKELFFEPSLKGEDRAGLEMAVDLIVEVDPQPDKMADMYIEVGKAGFYKKVLQPIRGIVRRVLGQYNAENIMSQRAQLEKDIAKELADMFSLNPYYKLVNVQLKKIYLPSNVSKAIEKVQLAKQEARAKQEQIKANMALAQSKIELAKGEAQATRERAQAEADKIKIVAKSKAEANRKIADSLTPELIQYETVKAWRDGGSQVPKVMLGDGGKGILVSPSELLKIK
jgi:regulator of protease activity HflC (stomatin/prohibitin superfamily)